jgi:hypothetical protein
MKRGLKHRYFPFWKAFAVLVHPDRWGDALEGIEALSHECMVWLNAHKPEGAERH